MLKDTTLQIFLTVYHGSLLGTFLYDYIIRSSVRVYSYGFDWTNVSNIALGVVFFMIVVWAIQAVWAKIRRNLLILLSLLVVMFIVRLGVGIPDAMEKFKYLPTSQYREELAVYIASIVVHALGIFATWGLANTAGANI